MILMCVKLNKIKNKVKGNKTNLKTTRKLKTLLGFEIKCIYFNKAFNFCV